MTLRPEGLDILLIHPEFKTGIRRLNMATYECKKCGMSVNATCGECDAPLENDVLKLDNGNEVQISKCPNGHGKIKSPLCCGQDMSCSIA